MKPNQSKQTIDDWNDNNEHKWQNKKNKQKYNEQTCKSDENVELKVNELMLIAIYMISLILMQETINNTNLIPIIIENY